MTERQLTLMAVHAHPDDEATGTGGLLAKCAAEGIRTVLVTCTDGACGDAPGGVKPGTDGHDAQALVQLRERELRASCEVLGVDELELLGYRDSGMMGWPDNDAPGSFWTVPVPDAAARLAQLMHSYQPDVVVTYDENGFYGHPDHIQAHRITMAALALTAEASAESAAEFGGAEFGGAEFGGAVFGGPAKVYWTTAPRSKMAEFGEVMRELGADWDEPAGDGGQDGDAPAGDGGPPPDIGLPDEEITTWLDTSEFGGLKYDALAAHASQSENIFFLRMGKERFTQLMGMETYVRVHDRTGAALPEDDLFAGLR